MISRLEIQEISASCNTLKLIDTSSYNPDITISNGILEVTPPGFSCPVTFNVEANFSVTLNSSTLQVAPAVTVDQLLELPDGVYYYKYSVQPNTQLFVEYSALRTCQLDQRFYHSVCELFSEREKITRREFEHKRKNLIWIRELIDAARYKVSECDHENAGVEMYNEANRLLDRKHNCYC